MAKENENQTSTAIDTMTKSVETIGKKVDETEKTVAEIKKQGDELVTFRDNVTKDVGSLKQQMKDAYDGAYKTGSYKGVFKSEKDATMFGHIILAFVNKDKASLDYLQKANIDTTTGANLIPTNLSRNILDLVQDVYGKFRANCMIWPDTPDNIPTQTSDLTVTVPGEATAPAGSAPGFSNISLTYKMFAALTYITKEVSQDSVIPLAEVISRSIARAFGVSEDLIGFAGTGAAGTPYWGYTGITGSIGTAGVIETTSATFSDLSYNDIENLIAQLPEIYDGDAAFYCSRSVHIMARKVKDAAGNQLGYFDRDARGFTLHGYPVVISQAFPKSTAVTAGSKFLYFGSLRNCALMAEKQGLTVAQSEHYKFAENMNTVMATKRTGYKCFNAGDTTNPGAMVALKLKSGT